MNYFIIIETENGNNVIECPEGLSPIEAAEANDGILVDEGPFRSYEDAMDALDQLQPDEDER